MSCFGIEVATPLKLESSIDQRQRRTRPVQLQQESSGPLQSLSFSPGTEIKVVIATVPVGEHVQAGRRIRQVHLRQESRNIFGIEQRPRFSLRNIEECKGVKCRLDQNLLVIPPSLEAATNRNALCGPVF